MPAFFLNQKPACREIVITAVEKLIPISEVAFSIFLLHFDWPDKLILLKHLQRASPLLVSQFFATDD